MKRRQVQSPFELNYRRKPDLSDLNAAPGELVVVGWDGSKAGAGEQYGEQGYYVMPTGAGHLVRAFRTGTLRHTKSVRTITDPGEVTSTLMSLRHAILTGKYREGSGRPPRPLVFRRRAHGCTQRGVPHHRAPPSAGRSEHYSTTCDGGAVSGRHAPTGPQSRDNSPAGTQRAGKAGRSALCSRARDATRPTG